MKKPIRFTCLLLAVLMLAGLATGCNSESKDPDNVGGTPTPTPGGLGEASLTEITLPLTNDPNAELSVFITFHDATISDLNDCENIQYLQEVTGVKINWVMVNETDMAQRWQLLPVSNNIPDILYPLAGSYNIDQGIEDGWIIDMSELIEKYMPNTRAFLDYNPKAKKDSESTDGVVKQGVLKQGNDQGPLPEWTTMGLCMRQDLVDQAGYTGPLETVNDYYNMLTTVKRHFPNMTSPLYTNFGFVWASSFLHSFGAYPGGFIDHDDRVRYGPAEPEYGVWLNEMRKWYAEGLIEPNFDSVGLIDGIQAPASVISTDMTVLFSGVYSRIGTVMPIAYGLTQDPNVRIVPVKAPLWEGFVEKEVEGDWSGFGNSVISADCKNPELAAKWLDFMLTEQAMRIIYYGKEGVHYTVDDSPGARFKYVYTEDYNTVEKRKGKIGSPTVGWYNWSAGYQSIKYEIEDTIASMGIESDDNFETIMGAIEYWSDGPAINFRELDELRLTAEEQNQISTIATDIGTYAAEYMVQYIKGLTDQSFDSYVIVLKNDLQLDRYLEIQQQVYDRQK